MEFVILPSKLTLPQYTQVAKNVVETEILDIFISKKISTISWI
jgi:hypothetical protein